MDNTPRGRGSYFGILWVDALAQQALSALYIAQIAEILGETGTVNTYRQAYDARRELLNRYYWDDRDGLYYDVMTDDPTQFYRVKTPASFWSMLAEACDDDQAARMSEHLRDPETFGDDPPWPSLAHNDSDYESRGMYWRGSVWLPTVYMGIKALERYGMRALADTTAEQVVNHQVKTYDACEPRTIWECYHPEAPEPATGKDNVTRVRPDFCGWSALGPISLFIENILGFHTVDAAHRRVAWRYHQAGRHGIRRLHFGDVETDIIANGDGTVETNSNTAYTLEINGVDHDAPAGHHTFDIGEPETNDAS